MKKHYLDYAAATPVDERVIEAMTPYFNQNFYNPSAIYLPSVQIKQQYKNFKTIIANYIGAKADQLIMTAGATEAINLAFSGHQSVIVSAIDHPSAIKIAQSKTNYSISNIDANGITEIDDLISKITDETSLISISLVSSDLGTIQPIRQLAEKLKKINLDRQLINKKPILLHCDAAQGLGYLNINVARLGADLITISGAKIYAPKQIGALWVKPGIKIKPIIIGGGQEMGMRGGTENVAFVAGFAKAIELIKRHFKPAIAKKRDKLQLLLTELENVTVLANHKKRLPNFLVISFNDIDAERIIYRLEEKGVFVATGSACAANYQTGSLALKSLEISDACQNGSIRITLSMKSEIEKVAKIIKQEVLLERNRCVDN